MILSLPGTIRVPLLIALAASTIPWARTTAAPLPEPLTLEIALSQADSDHPDLVAVAARQATRRGNQAAAEALTGIPSRFDADDKADEMQTLFARQRRRLKILRCFLGVLRSDFEYARENEAMAIAYVSMDRAARRNSLGQISDIALAERQSRYQAARLTRYAAEAAQRASRSRLALALNRPGELSSLLEPPALGNNAMERPEIEELEARALANNARLQAIRYRLEAAGERLAAARESASDAKSAAGESAPVGDQIVSRARIVAAAIARREAEVARLRGVLASAEHRVRQRVLDQWLSLHTLSAARDEASVYTEYRDLYLDRSRALYEQQMQVDLGDAMVETSEALLRSARAQFDLTMAWARIHILTGTPPDALSAHILGSAP
jgi:outer membrane protein TolC